MAILRTRETWKKPTVSRARGLDITPEEQANVRAAIRVLRLRYGSIAKLAAAMGASERTLGHAAARDGKPSAALAIRIARAAGVPVEDILAGNWPAAGACPMCGRGPE